MNEFIGIFQKLITLAAKTKVPSMGACGGALANAAPTAAAQEGAVSLELGASSINMLERAACGDGQRITRQKTETRKLTAAGTKSGAVSMGGVPGTREKARTLELSATGTRVLERFTASNGAQRAARQKTETLGFSIASAKAKTADALQGGTGKSRSMEVRLDTSKLLSTISGAGGQAVQQVKTRSLSVALTKTAAYAPGAAGKTGSLSIGASSGKKTDPSGITEKTRSLSLRMSGKKASYQLSMSSTSAKRGTADDGSAAMETAAKTSNALTKLQGVAGKTKSAFSSMWTSFRTMGKSALGTIKNLAGNVLGRLKQLAKQGFADAMGNTSAEARMKGRLGGEAGSAAAQLAKRDANAYSRGSAEVMQSTETFSRLTSDTGQMKQMNDLSHLFASFTRDNDMAGMSSMIAGAAQTGDVSGLSSALGISREAMEQFKVPDMAKAGNVDGFLNGLQQAAAAAGITGQALAEAAASPEAKFRQLSNTLKNGFEGAAESLLTGLAPALDRLIAFFQSPEGQQFFHALAAVMQIAGTAAGLLVDGLISLASFISDNLSTILAVGIALLLVWAISAIAAGIASMISFIAANWPILLVVAAIALVIVILQKLGVSFEQMGQIIGGVLGLVMGVFQNCFAYIWNIVAGFIEFFVNVWNDPIGSIVRLFVSLADTVLGIVRSIASVIDKIFGTNWASSINGLQNKMNRWAETKFKNEGVKIERMETKELGQFWDQGYAMGGKIGKKLDELDMGGLQEKIKGISQGGDRLPKQGGGLSALSGQLPDIGSVDRVDKVGGEVNIAEEDLKFLSDAAERKYVNEVNLTQLTPSVTVQVDASGDPEAIGADVAAQVKRVLQEQIAYVGNYAYGE